ncbi:hypothetical protein MTR67_013253, partial [Solanum verrucosum]
MNQYSAPIIHTIPTPTTVVEADSEHEVPAVVVDDVSVPSDENLDDVPAVIADGVSIASDENLEHSPIIPSNPDEMLAPSK